LSGRRRSRATSAVDRPQTVPRGQGRAGRAHSAGPAPSAGGSQGAPAAQGFIATWLLDSYRVPGKDLGTRAAAEPAQVRDRSPATPPPRRGSSAPSTASRNGRGPAAACQGEPSCAPTPRHQGLALERHDQPGEGSGSSLCQRLNPVPSANPSCRPGLADDCRGIVTLTGGDKRLPTRASVLERSQPAYDVQRVITIWTARRRPARTSGEFARASARPAATLPGCPPRRQGRARSRGGHVGP
jgi:hypothetical protein